MKVRYTPRAFSDLDNIWNYISRFDSAAAGRVIAVVEKIVARLADFPESGQQSDIAGVRVIYTTRYPYRIYYRIEPDAVSILHIRHTARSPVELGSL